MEGARDIFVISDLHLGDGGARDNFEPHGRTEQLHQFLDHVGSEGGELFILGDLFEFWQMNISRILAYRRPLLDHFARLPLVYVPGNHDVDLLYFIGSGLLDHPFFARMRRPFDRQIGGRRFHFFHGHETDPFNNSENPGFGQMLSIFSGLFEDQNGSPLLATGETMETVLEQFGESMLALWTAATVGVSARVGLERGIEPQHALTPAQNPDRLTEHIESIRAASRREGWDVAVLGHTHKAGRIGDWYHNSGTWAAAKNTFLRIDPQGDVRYFEWRRGRAVEQAAPLVRLDGPPERNPLQKAADSVRVIFPGFKRPERSRLVLLARGALALALGIWTFFLAFAYGRATALAALISAFGLYPLLSGALSLGAASRQHAAKRLVDRLVGATSMILGLVFLTHRESLEVFAVLAGVSVLLAGALRTAVAVVFRGTVVAPWLWVVGLGATGVGLILLFLPLSAPLLVEVIAGYLCFIGASEAIGGLLGRQRGGQLWRLLS